MAWCTSRTDQRDGKKSPVGNKIALILSFVWDVTLTTLVLGTVKAVVEGNLRRGIGAFLGTKLVSESKKHEVSCTFRILEVALEDV